VARDGTTYDPVIVDGLSEPFHPDPSFPRPMKVDRTIVFEIPADAHPKRLKYVLDSSLQEEVHFDA
jgi:hypothetical protein